MNMKVFSMIIRLVMAFCLAITTSFSAMAQTEAPVRWRTFVRMSSPTEGTITLRALVAPGNHVYGTDIPAGGPVATKVDFSESAGIKLIGSLKSTPEPDAVVDPMFGMTVRSWSSNFELSQPFRLVASPDKATVKVKITYMSCDDSNCRPPKTETITARVPDFKKK